MDTPTEPRIPVPAMALALEASFGSVERWREDFASIAHAPGGDAGWVLLEFAPLEGRLVNRRIADPKYVLATEIAILALDMRERGTPITPGAVSGSRADLFIAQIDWTVAHERYKRAIDEASEAFGATPEQADGAVLIDVRRAGVFERASTMIAGARWRDPATVSSWAGELPDDRPVVTYCVHGHDVSRAAALRLRAAGSNARFLRGGIEAWQAEDRPLQARAQPA